MKDGITEKLHPANNLTDFTVTNDDVDFFNRHLRNFVPTESFDSHAHFYENSHLGNTLNDNYLKYRPNPGGWAAYQKHLKMLMGDRAPQGGLFFAMPRKDVNMRAANEFVAEQVSQSDKLRGLLLIHPKDDPDHVNQQITDQGFVGIKVYLTYADRDDPYNADIEEFLPDWAWEIADKNRLVIMLHMVKPRAIADTLNQQYIREHCLRYPNANLILAHCARSFNSGHILEGLDSLRGLENIFFDNSAICEPQPVEEILKIFGPSRLLFGTDFPVSMLRGRAVSTADGFLWLGQGNVDWSTAAFGNNTVLGLESILALKHGCQRMNLIDTDIERIFFQNAYQLFKIEEQEIGRGQNLYIEAKKIIPGGTQLLSKRPELWAPDQWPVYYKEARGCSIIDMDGQHYTDFSVNGIGSTMLGYADPDVTAAVIRRVQHGSMCSLNVPEEMEVARLLLQLHPWADNARFTRAGGESLTVAVRIARAATQRQNVAICGYHGWHDWYIATNIGTEHNQKLNDHLLKGIDPAGVPSRLGGTTFPFRYGELQELEQIFDSAPEPLAAIVMEPTRSEDPAPDFLPSIRKLCNEHGVKLIFDEVSIGWKLVVGGAHLKYGVNPDIAVFAKSTANGHPMGAIIGNEETMQAAQESFISSSFWTEGVGPAAAVATIKKMMQVDVVGHVDRIGQSMKDVWLKLGAQYKLPLTVDGHNASCGFSLNHPKVRALETLFTVRMLKAGFLATPHITLTLAHEPYHVEAYAKAAEPIFYELATAIEKDDVESRIGGPIRHSGFQRLT